MPSRWSGAESRLLYRTRQEEMTDALDAFEQSDAPAIKTLEDAKLADTKVKDAAFWNISHGVTNIIGYFNSKWALDRRLDEVAQERMEKASASLLQSKDFRTRQLEKLYRSQGFEYDVVREKVVVIEEMLANIAKERERLTQRADKYSKLKHLTATLQGEADTTNKALDAQESDLQAILNDAKNTIQEQEEGDPKGMDEAKTNDELLRGTIMNALDLKSGAAQRLIESLDAMLLGQVLNNQWWGNTERVERFITDFSNQPNVRPQDVAIVRQAITHMKKNPGAVRYYRDMRRTQAEMREKRDLESIMKSIKTLSLGATVQLGDKVHTVLKQDKDRDAVIVRQIGTGNVYAVDTVPVSDGTYRALHKDAAGNTAWITLQENTPPPTPPTA